MSTTCFRLKFISWLINWLNTFVGLMCVWPRRLSAVGLPREGTQTRYLQELPWSGKCQKQLQHHMSWLVGEIPLKILLFSENAITNQSKESLCWWTQMDLPNLVSIKVDWRKHWPGRQISLWCKLSLHLFLKPVLLWAKGSNLDTHTHIWCVCMCITHMTKVKTWLFSSVKVLYEKFFSWPRC